MSEYRPSDDEVELMLIRGIRNAESVGDNDRAYELSHDLQQYRENFKIPHRPIKVAAS